MDLDTRDNQTPSERPANGGPAVRGRLLDSEAPAAAAVATALAAGLAFAAATSRVTARAGRVLWQGAVIGLAAAKGAVGRWWPPLRRWLIAMAAASVPATRRAGRLLAASTAAVARATGRHIARAGAGARRRWPGVRVRLASLDRSAGEAIDDLSDRLHEWCGRGIAAVGAWRAQEQALRPRRTQVERPLPIRLARGVTLGATLVGLVAGSVVVGGGFAIDAATSAVAVSNPDDVVLPVLPERSELFAADGSSLGVVQADDGNRVSVPLDQVPKVVLHAVIATEDARFWVHDGVDLSGVARAARRNVAAGGIEQGGSTITQQLAKSTLEAPKRDLRRKLTEAVLAVRLDDQLDKRAILERYLNTIYFGEGAYGVATAAETYFGRPLADVTVDQAALLAGLIRGPSLYNPLTDPDSARGRRRTVLDRMVGEGYLTVAEADAAHAAPLPMELHHRTPAVGYVADAVRAELLADPRLGDTPEARARLLASGGLRVHTTVDPRLQDEAQQAVTGGLPAGNRLTAALASVEPATGAVRAVVGGPDYGVSQFNAAVTGQGRQTGSAFKVFTLVAALRGGHVSSEQIDGSSPCEIPNPGGTPNPWRPENYEGESSGRVTITDATVHSSNCAFARLAADVGPEAVAATAAAMGVTAPLHKVPSMTLGTNSVPPLQMAAAYATLAADGVARAPHIVERVERRDGSVVVVNDQPGQRVIDEQTARLATSVLTQVVARGTGRAAALGERPVAGKTGTAQNHQDAWFVGYTPQLATAVWMGDVDGEKPMLNVGGINVTGGSYPARIWRRFMAAAHTGLPTTHFSAPAPEAAPPPPPPEPAAPTSPAEETRSSNGKGGGKGKRDR